MKKRGKKKHVKRGVFWVGLVIMVIGALVIGSIALTQFAMIPSQTVSPGQTITISFTAGIDGPFPSGSTVPFNEEPYQMWATIPEAPYAGTVKHTNMMFGDTRTFSFNYVVPDANYIASNWNDPLSDKDSFVHTVLIKIMLYGVDNPGVNKPYNYYSIKLYVDRTGVMSQVTSAIVTLTGWVDGSPIDGVKITRNGVPIGGSNNVALPFTDRVPIGLLPGEITYCLTEWVGTWAPGDTAASGCRSFNLNFGDVIDDGKVTMTVPIVTPTTTTPTTVLTTTTVPTTTNGVTTTTTATTATTTATTTVTQTVETYHTTLTETSYVPPETTESPTTNTTADQMAPPVDYAPLFPGIALLGIGGGMMAYSKKR